MKLKKQVSLVVYLARKELELRWGDVCFPTFIIKVLHNFEINVDFL